MKLDVPTSATSFARRSLIAAAVAAVASVPGRAGATYGEFAKIAGEGVSSLPSGDAANECLFATPGTGVCQVYKSSDPVLWATPDTAKALQKLVDAARALDALDGYIAASKWTAISQSLGASRDLREAVGFLTSQAADGKAAAQAKKVFTALDGVSVAVQKRDKVAAGLYFAKYSTAMPELIKMLGA